MCSMQSQIIVHSSKCQAIINVTRFISSFSDTKQTDTRKHLPRLSIFFAQFLSPSQLRSKLGFICWRNKTQTLRYTLQHINIKGIPSQPWNFLLLARNWRRSTKLKYTLGDDSATVHMYGISPNRGIVIICTHQPNSKSIRMCFHDYQDESNEELCWFRPAMRFKFFYLTWYFR